MSLKVFHLVVCQIPEYKRRSVGEGIEGWMSLIALVTCYDGNCSEHRREKQICLVWFAFFGQRMASSDS